jgi:5-formyltetrahydrofolate cyclo-ligase
MELPAELHREKSLRVIERLSSCFGDLDASLVGFYWPFSGEIDVRPFIELVLAYGGNAALPVVIAKNQPLEFRAWKPGNAMTTGAYGIPHPVQGPSVEPDVLIVPLLGFDSMCYRLGYGGGFYDRTLRTALRRPVTIGVGFELARLDTIQPQPYDVPMDLILTEVAMLRHTPADVR